MRILHVNKFLYRRGGAEAYMEDVAALQSEAGHEVSFFGMAHPENTHNEWADFFPPQIELDPLPAGLRDRAQAAARALWSTTARRGMVQVLREFRPDVVHFHNIYHHLSPSVIKPARDAGAATVLTLHDYKLACPSYLFMSQGQVCDVCIDGKFRHAVQRRCKGGSLVGSALLAVETGLHRHTRAYGGIQVFVCPSRFMRDKMTEAGVFPDRLTVVPSFVDLAAPAKDPLPRTAARIVYASRLAPEKGVDVAVAAMAELPEATLHVAGEGPEHARLRELADRCAPGRVFFLGRLSKPAVAELIASASAVVAPSRCYENLPLTVLEAMAAGRPVVGSALGGIAELVRPGVTGQLVPPDDPSALANALRALLQSADVGARMGERARAVIADEYSRERHLAMLTRLYADLVGEQTEPVPAGAITLGADR